MDKIESDILDTLKYMFLNSTNHAWKDLIPTTITDIELNRLAGWDFALKGVICECGKEKHGFAKHTNWCDIKDEE